MNATLETIDGRPALRFERHLPHAVERVWRAVTEPRELEHWFVAPVPWKPELGEVFAGAGQTGRITELQAPHVIAWTWGEERYRFELQRSGEGCVLVFTHVFDEGLGSGAQHAAGWEAYLARLDAHLGGGALSEEQAHANVGERHEHYAARFGVDPEPGRRLFAAMAPLPVTLHDGPSLRLERRYEHPIERVWRAISDPAELEQWFPSGEPLEVSEREAPFLVAGTWFGDALRFELRPDGAGCVLVFTHAFADRETSARTAAGWDRCFARLDALLAERPMSESDSLQTWLDVHERYAEAFGVDPEIGRAAYASHPLT